MPQVTLLGHKTTTYTLFSGLVEYFFEGGKAQEVPVSVALEAKKKTKGNNASVFSVLALPNIVGSPDNPPIKDAVIAGIDEQNVNRKPTNLRFETWL